MRKNVIIAFLLALPIAAFAVTPSENVQTTDSLIQFKSTQKSDSDIVLNWCQIRGQSCW